MTTDDIDQLATSRPLVPEETEVLTILLKSHLNLPPDRSHQSSQADEDANDLICYALDMIGEGEKIGHVVEELGFMMDSMEMKFDDGEEGGVLEDVKLSLGEFVTELLLQDGEGGDDEELLVDGGNEEEEDIAEPDDRVGGLVAEEEEPVVEEEEPVEEPVEGTPALVEEEPVEEGPTAVQTVDSTPSLLSGGQNEAEEEEAGIVGLGGELDNDPSTPNEDIVMAAAEVTDAEDSEDDMGKGEVEEGGEGDENADRSGGNSLLQRVQLLQQAGEIDLSAKAYSRKKSNELRVVTEHARARGGVAGKIAAMNGCGMNAEQLRLREANPDYEEIRSHFSERLFDAREKSRLQHIEHEAKLRDLQSELDGCKEEERAELEEARRERDEALEDAQQWRLHASKMHAEETARLEEEHRAVIEEHEMRLKAEMEANARLTEEIDDMRKMLESASESGGEKAALEEEHKAVVMAMKEEHEMRLNDEKDANARLTKEIDDMRKMLESASNSGEEKAALEEEHKSVIIAIKEVDEKHLNAEMDANARLTEELDEVRKMLEQAKNERDAALDKLSRREANATFVKPQQEGGNESFSPPTPTTTKTAVSTPDSSFEIENIAMEDIGTDDSQEEDLTNDDSDTPKEDSFDDFLALINGGNDSKPPAQEPAKGEVRAEQSQPRQSSSSNKISPATADRVISGEEDVEAIRSMVDCAKDAKSKASGKNNKKKRKDLKRLIASLEGAVGTGCRGK